jgi:hypothetical protein
MSGKYAVVAKPAVGSRYSTLVAANSAARELARNSSSRDEYFVVELCSLVRLKKPARPVEIVKVK